MNAIARLMVSACVFAVAACGGDTTSSPTAAATASPQAVSLIPANGDAAAYTDTRLSLAFDTAPVLTGQGTIRVYRADGTLVDTIDPGAANVLAGGETQTALGSYNTEIDKIGNNVASLTQYRFTYYRPVTIAGNVATIKLHDGVLTPNTSYYVQVDANAFNGGFAGKSTFGGITGATAWTFKTKANPTTATAVSVDDDGSADFRSVQGALDYMMATGCTSCANASAAKTITVKNGTYDEQLFLRNVNNLTLQGESRTGTVVQNSNWDAFNPGTGGSRATANTTLSNIGGSSTLGNRRALGGGRPVFLVEGGDLLKLTNFTLRNTHVKDATQNSQAETIYFNSANINGSRLIATSMNFISNQDTVQVKGWVWIYNSLIAGDVDYVWGSPFAVALENDELRTVVDAATPASGGYIFQSRAAKGFPGFVVLGGALTAEAGVPTGSTYLARSAGQYQAAGNCTTVATLGGSLGNPQIFCDNVAYVGVTMGAHIAAAGWFINPLPNLLPTATEGWRESGSLSPSGAPLPLTGRERTYATSSADLSALNTRAKIFAQWNNGAGWNPQP